MKIVFLIGVNNVGGAEYVSCQHVLMAHSSGMDVTVLSETTGLFYDIIKSAGVNISITKNSVSFIESALVGCDIVFNCNSFSIVQIVTSLKKRLGFNYVAIIHSNIDWVYQQFQKFDSFTDGYYAIHPKIVDSFVQKGMDKNKFTTIPNCVDTKKVRKNLQQRKDVREKYGFGDTDFVIGMITRICNDKNVMDAVRILNKIPANSKLFIIGGAAQSESSRWYKQKVLAEISRLGLNDRVVISGNVTSDEVYRLMQAFDIGLNCSPSEGLPIALLEMMGSEIACVMPSIGEIPDVIGNDRGMVIDIRQRFTFDEILAEPCYNSDEIMRFVSGITYLIKEEKTRLILGKNAGEYIKNHRSLELQEQLLFKFLNNSAPQKGTIDVVYILGMGSKWSDNEIRFSIRSFVQNFKDLRNVVIVGELPPFLRGVVHIRCSDKEGVNKDARMALKLKAACTDARVSENFIFCTDDTLLLAPLTADDFCGWHDGPIKYNAIADRAEHNRVPDSSVPPSDWFKFVYNTGIELKKRNLPDNNYDRAHAPQPINKKEFLQVINEWDMEGNYYTISNIYNNSSKIFTGKQTGLNAKIYRAFDINEIVSLTAGKQCLNYNDEALNEDLKQWLITNYSEPSKYEMFDSGNNRRYEVEQWFKRGCNYDEGIEIFRRYAPRNQILLRYLESKRNNENSDKKLKYTLKLWLQ